jgi:hypothetical protein
MEDQMHLQGAACEPGADILEGRSLHDREAEQVLIEGERPGEIGDDERNVVEHKLSHRRRLTQWLGKAIRRARLGESVERRMRPSRNNDQIIQMAK